MVKLISQTPCRDLLPRTIGGVTLTEAPAAAMWSVAPYRGQEKSVSTALGIGLPKPNRTTSGAEMRALWGGPGLVYVFASALPDLSALAAVTDQSDGWATVIIEGPDTEAVLARLVPIDVRLATFKTGHTARTMVGHMTASLTRTSRDRIEVMVMRSMAATLVHDLSRAATLFAGRNSAFASKT